MCFGVAPIDEIQVAMSHDGNFDRFDAGREFCVGWRTHRTWVPSNTDLSRAAQGTDRRQPSCLESIRVPTMVPAPRRWQCTVCKSFVDSTDAIPVAASPCCSIEITRNHVNLLTNHDGTDREDDCGFAKCSASHARLDVVTAPDTIVVCRQELLSSCQGDERELGSDSIFAFCINRKEVQLEEAAPTEAQRSRWQPCLHDLKHRSELAILPTRTEMRQVTRSRSRASVCFVTRFQMLPSLFLLVVLPARWGN